MDEEVSLGEVINSHIEYSMQDRYTALPGVILRVHNKGSTQTVDVQPSVGIKNRDGTTTQQATILNVPYQQPASSLGGTVFPVAAGDNVLLVFCMRGIDTWKYGDGGLNSPSDFRMFSNLDCVAIPCIAPTKNAPTSTSKHSGDYSLGDTITYNGSTEIIQKPDGTTIVNSPAKVIVNSPEVEVNSQNVVVNASTSVIVNSPSTTFTGNVSVQGHLSYLAGISGVAGAGAGQGNSIVGGFSIQGGSIIHDGKNIGSTHAHTDVEPGSGTSGGPV